MYRLDPHLFCNEAQKRCGTLGLLLNATGFRCGTGEAAATEKTHKLAASEIQLQSHTEISVTLLDQRVID